MYKVLAHPELNGYVSPFTLEERLAHVREAKLRLGTQFRWLCDTMENDLKRAMGGAPNSEWVIGPDNVIVARREWSNPEALRADLARLVGPIANPTRVEDLHMTWQAPEAVAASGVVPRVARPDRMQALRLEPELKNGEVFYAKLRVEADRRLMQRGAGMLYLGFHMDPIHGAHWNNLVDPIEVEIEAPAGVAVTPSTLRGPKVTAAEGDVDPREFMVEVNGWTPGTRLRVTARYFACTSEWCLPFTQSYSVVLEADRDSHWSMPMRGFDPFAREAGSGRGQARPADVVTGEVSEVRAGGRVLLIRERDGTVREYAVSPTATILRGREASGFDTISPGDRVQFTFDADGTQRTIVRLRVTARERG